MDDKSADGTCSEANGVVVLREAFDHNISMLSRDRLLRLIGRIYDAASDESLWPLFLDEFAEAIQGTMTTLVYHDLTSQRASLMLSARCDPECPRQYVSYFSARDPYKTAGLARHRSAGPDTVYVGEELVASAQLTRTEFYNDFSLAHGMVRHFGTPIVITKNWVSNISSHRPGNREPFGLEEVKLLRLLLPHLQRAILFHRRFAELENIERASLDAIDRLRVGVILLDQAGAIIAMNREAHRTVALNDGLFVSKEGLSAASVSLKNELLAATGRAALTAQGEGSSAGGLFSIPRPSGKRPFHLAVSPIGRDAFGPGIRTPAVIVFVTDPDQQPESLADALARIFGLTRAEARLADYLRQGETMVETAEKLGISHNTARTHLQHIYEKTGTKHQGELVRLLHTGVLSAT
jgi:DNA-binding CsgD family transcriptional regulator